MPVEKFRTFDEATRALVTRTRPGADDATLPLRIAALWSMASSLAAPLSARGVRKFRTIEEAGADRDRMTLQRPYSR